MYWNTRIPPTQLLNPSSYEPHSKLSTILKSASMFQEYSLHFAYNSVLVKKLAMDEGNRALSTHFHWFCGVDGGIAIVLCLLILVVVAVDTL